LADLFEGVAGQGRLVGSMEDAGGLFRLDFRAGGVGLGRIGENGRSSDGGGAFNLDFEEDLRHAVVVGGAIHDFGLGRGEDDAAGGEGDAGRRTVGAEADGAGDGVFEVEVVEVGDLQLVANLGRDLAERGIGVGELPGEAGGIGFHEVDPLDFVAAFDGKPGFLEGLLVRTAEGEFDGRTFENGELAGGGRV
jgi:hypothetical protein